MKSTALSASMLTAEEQRDRMEVPELVTPPELEERVQVNVSKGVVDHVKGWLRADQSGTIKEVCDRAIRLWLTVYANVSRDGAGLTFEESQTGQDLKRLAKRLDPDLGAQSSPSVKQAYVARVGTQVAVALLRAPGAVDAGDDLFHEIVAAAGRSGRLFGDEVAERLRLAARVLAAPDGTPARDLRVGYTRTGG